jgi:hypothetical protein
MEAREAHTFAKWSPLSCDNFDPTKSLCLVYPRAIQCGRLQEQ